MTYVLGAVLLLLAARMLRSRDEPMDSGRSGSLRLLRRVVPLTGDASSGCLVARTGGGWAVTPLELAVVALMLADLTFAVDSISGAFGITTDFVAIWLANALSLLGLSVLVLVRVLVQRFRYMSQTFAAVLLFIAPRLLTGDLVSLSPLVSLAAIAAVLLGRTGSSAIGDRVAPPHATELRRTAPPAMFRPATPLRSARRHSPRIHQLKAGESREGDSDAEQRSADDVREPVGLEVCSAPGHPEHSQRRERPPPAPPRPRHGEQQDERDAGRTRVCGVPGRKR